MEGPVVESMMDLIHERGFFWEVFFQNFMSSCQAPQNINVTKKIPFVTERVISFSPWISIYRFSNNVNSVEALT